MTANFLIERHHLGLDKRLILRRILRLVPLQLNTILNLCFSKAKIRAKVLVEADKNLQTSHI